MFPILLANLVTQVMTARTPPRRERRPGRVRKGRRKPINLGLQGGGAHGAITWGVLDQLLDDGRLEIEGVSGASAGAVNAVMLADGLARGGADEARQRLADFWRAVSVDGHLPDLQRSVVERLFPFVPREGLWFGVMSRMLSPYDLNPLNINPLKDVIDRFVDFEAIRDNEHNFNAALLSELRGVAFVNRLIDEGRLPRGTREGEFRRRKLHRIVMEDVGDTFGARSTLKTDYEYFETLRKLGQRATRRFLDRHFNDIGRRSTIDIADKSEAELAET